LVEAVAVSTVSAAQLMSAPQLLLWAPQLLLWTPQLLLWTSLLLLWAWLLLLLAMLLLLWVAPMASLLAKSSLKDDLSKFQKS
jgi:hypothetical protein